MSKIIRKSEAELLQESEQQAEAALKTLPTPTQDYLTGSVEEDERQTEAEAAMLAKSEDERSSASDRDRLLRLEALAEQQAKLIADLKAGAAQSIIGVGADELPVRQKQWSEEELRELVTITIFADSDPNQNRPVSVAHNGTVYTMPRGKPVRVPRFVVQVLENAKITSWEYPLANGQFGAKTDLTPMTTSTPVLRSYPRFNFALG